MLTLSLVGGAATVALLAFPQKETYSDFGFGSSGEVDVKCGSVIDQSISVEFSDYNEQLLYRDELNTYGEPSIFEGETATEICTRMTKDMTTLGWAAGGASGLLFVIGIVLFARSSPAGSRSPASLPPPPPPPVGAAPPAPPAPGVTGIDVAAPIPPPALQLAPFAPMPSTPVMRPSVAPVVRQRVGGNGGIHDGMTVPRQAPVLAAPRVVERTVRFSDGSVRSFGSSIYIGRDPAPEGSGIAHQVSDPSVSKTHLRLTLTDGDVWVEDLHSTNGTSIVTMAGERTLIPGQPAVVDVGSSVQFGDLTLRLEPRP